MGEIHNTQFFRAVQEKKMDVSQVLELVYAALREKGYNPVVYGCLTASGETCGIAQKKAGSALGRNPLLREWKAQKTRLWYAAGALLGFTLLPQPAVEGTRCHAKQSGGLLSGDLLCQVHIAYLMESLVLLPRRSANGHTGFLRTRNAFALLFAESAAVFFGRLCH